VGVGKPFVGKYFIGDKSGHEGSKEGKVTPRCSVATTMFPAPIKRVRTEGPSGGSWQVCAARTPFSLHKHTHNAMGRGLGMRKQHTRRGEVVPHITLWF
jgi:hypothetical protein